MFRISFFSIERIVLAGVVCVGGCLAKASRMSEGRMCFARMPEANASRISSTDFPITKFLNSVARS